MDFELLSRLHALPTLLMCGVVWVVQIVHYPLYARVGESHFADYEREHCTRIGFVVLPLMLIEAALASWMLFKAPAELRGLAIAGVVLLAVIWLSTFLIQVPCHRRLERGFEHAAWSRLVRSNWIRTVAWSLRGGLAALLVA